MLPILEHAVTDRVGRHLFRRKLKGTAGLGSAQCQGEVAAYRGGGILITWCLALRLGAAFGLAGMRFVGIRCEGPAGVT